MVCFSSECLSASFYAVCAVKSDSGKRTRSESTPIFLLASAPPLVEFGQVFDHQGTRGAAELSL